MRDSDKLDLLMYYYRGLIIILGLGGGQSIFQPKLKFS